MDWKQITVKFKPKHKKMHLKMSSAKWPPFCLGLNMLPGCCVYCNWDDYGFDPNRFQELHRARPNGRHFAKKNDDMFKFIFVYDSNFMEICSSALLKISRKAISWTNDGLYYWSMHASLGLEELSGYAQIFFMIYYTVYDLNGWVQKNMGTFFSHLYLYKTVHSIHMAIRANLKFKN